MIGVFDSGVGGLSVFRELYALMPEQDYVYLSDAAHCPYGNKPVEYIIERAEAITRFLIDKGAEVVVIACNTATAAAVKYLREKYPIPFVGMEPAIKPAALTSKTGVVGVLATANTFKGSLYHNTLEKFASDVTVIEKVGEGLVEFVESGQTEGPEVEKVLHKYIDPMLEADADAVVLGCTHYPFLESTIRKIAGDQVNIINPAPAIALQTQRILDALEGRKSTSSKSLFYSTGDTTIMRSLVAQIAPSVTDEAFEEISIK
ncbi:MAG: glutamate racemase [Bacteroidales bacterium]|nr:glutamate racemase [Bacteroidales bacterium]